MRRHPSLCPSRIHAVGAQVARAEVDAAKGQLAQLQQLHGAEASAASAHLQRLVAHLEATQPEALPMLLPAELLESLQAVVRQPPAAAGPQPGWATAVAALSREAELEKAVEASETAVAVMQSRLLQALQVRLSGWPVASCRLACALALCRTVQH